MAAKDSSASATPRRRRRLNRHKVFALHILIFIVGSALIWSFNAPLLDKQFDTLIWLTVLAAHGMVIYYRRKVALLLHLVFFSAGNAAVWATSATMPEKLMLTFAWVFVSAIPGIWLFRRLYLARNPAGVVKSAVDTQETPPVAAKPARSATKAKAPRPAKPKRRAHEPLDPVVEPDDDADEVPDGYGEDEDEDEDETDAADEVYEVLEVPPAKKGRKRRG